MLHFLNYPTTFRESACSKYHEGRGEGKEVITVMFDLYMNQLNQAVQGLTSDEDHSEVEDGGDDSVGGVWGQEGEDLCEATCVEFRPV